MILFSKLKDCCGCSACETVCPVGIIKMVQNDEGFYYPRVIDEDKCINCGKCQTVCPLKTEKLKHSALYVLAGISKDEYVWRTSSSGGLFSLICKAINNKDSLFVGARWDGLSVVMDCFESIDEQELFRKSKYISANPNHIYETVIKELKKGKYVVFSGTPCQVQGLINVTNNKFRDKMLLIDFACHGQGSPFLFNRWLSFLEDKYQKKIRHFEFREKLVIYDHVNSNCCSYSFVDGTKRIVTRDYYHHAYVKGLCMRPSCSNCSFAEARASDITLADFKSLTEGLPQYRDIKNVSTVICNTIKGKQVIGMISDVKWLSCDESFVYQKNPKLIKCLPGNDYRDKFMLEALSGNANILKLIKKYAQITPSEWVEYNCSEVKYKRFYSLLSFIDRIFRKLKNFN